MQSNTAANKVDYLFSGAVALGCALTLLTSIYRIVIPYQINYAEGPILSGAMRVAHGGTVYPPLGTLPYVLNAYGVVGYYVMAFVVKIHGASFLYPRLLVLLSATLVCLLISLLLHEWTRSWRLSLTLGFIYLTIPLVHPWLYVLRLDFIALLLTLAGLYLFVALPRHWYLSVPIFGLAIFCLYTLVAAPGACFWYLIARKEWKKASLFAAAMAALIVLVFLWEQHRTGGWFSFYMFGTHSSPYSIRQWAEYVRPVLRSNGLLFVLALGMVSLDASQRAISLPVIYLGLCSLTSLTAGKQGALDNHLLQLVIAACLCAGLAYQRLREKSSGQVAFAVVTAALGFMVLANTSFGFRKPIDDLAECNQAYGYLRTHVGNRILSENVGVLITEGRPVLLSDPFVYRWLVSGGAHSAGDLEQLVSAHYFDLIVLNNHIDDGIQDNWPLSVRDTIEQNYTPVKQFVCRDTRYFYEPKTKIDSLADSVHSGY